MVIWSAFHIFYANAGTTIEVPGQISWAFLLWATWFALAGLRVLNVTLGAAYLTALATTILHVPKFVWCAPFVVPLGIAYAGTLRHT